MKSFSCAIAAAVGLAIAVPAGGQQLSPSSQASPAQIAHLVELELASADAREVAWGAFNAGTYQVASATPLLQRVLEAPAATPEPEHLALIDAVLDALIQLHAHVPASSVVSYLELRPVQTLVLLSTSADRDSVLRHLLTTTSGWRWFSAANVLLRDKDPGLAPHLLSTLTLRLTITVFDGPVPVGDGYGGSISGGERQFPNPAGYPPHVSYAFDTKPYAGMIVLAVGPTTVYYSRTASNDIPDTFHDLAIGEPNASQRLAYLQAMLPSSDLPKLQSDTNVSIRWSTSEALIQQVEKARVDVDRQFHAMLGTLVQNGWLTSEEAAALPSPMNVQLVDQRNDRSMPLPPIRR